MNALERTVEIAGGIAMPQVGLGVFQVPDDGTARVVHDALAVGYRHLDTAAAYGNEEALGSALAASGLDRDEVFVTSKLRNGDQGYAEATEAYRQTCARLGVAAVDLYLIHWPNPAAGRWQDSWRALEDLLDAGAVRAIGVSNFLPEHLEELDGFARHVPAVNQIEVHPAFAQPETIRASTTRGIAVVAYSPLGRGTALGNPVVTGIAGRLGVSPAQVVLRWHLQQGRLIIPKTTSQQRMRENADLEGFHLSPQDLDAIDALERGERTGNDPRTFSHSQIR